MTESRFRTVGSPDDFYAAGIPGPHADAVALHQAGTHLLRVGGNIGDELVQVTIRLLG